jgi:homoserine kinase type II
VSDEAAILAALASWEIPAPIALVPLLGGFNSHTWRVSCDAGEFVAKLAPSSATFEAGLAVAEQLEQAGFRAGGPLRTRRGALTAPLARESLALLRFVHGRPIDPLRRDDLRIWGETMAQLHRVQRKIASVPVGLPRWPWAWLDPTVAYLDVEPWVRPMVERALGEVRQLEAVQPLTLGIVHGDGASVLVDGASGQRAIIDWGAAMWGPLLYDVASARWLFQFKDGGDPADFVLFLEAYRHGAPMPAQELGGLDAFVRLRCAVQALYFAWRIADDVRTGLADPAANRRGLDQARRAWQQLE